MVLMSWPQLEMFAIVHVIQIWERLYPSHPNGIKALSNLSSLPRSERAMIPNLYNFIHIESIYLNLFWIEVLLKFFESDGDLIHNPLQIGK